jgi:hypothetical protein
LAFFAITFSWTACTPYGKDSDVAVDFRRYWDLVLRDHPEVVQGDADGRYLSPGGQKQRPQGRFDTVKTPS